MTGDRPAWVSGGVGRLTTTRDFRPKRGAAGQLPESLFRFVKGIEVFLLLLRPIGGEPQCGLVSQQKRMTKVHPPARVRDFVDR